MFKKFVAMLCAGTLVFSMAGCGGSKDSAKEDTKTEAKGDSKEDEDVTISILWQQEVSEQFWDLPLEKFKEKYPNVNVEFESNAKAAEVIRNLLNVKEAPDIF